MGARGPNPPRIVATPCGYVETLTPVRPDAERIIGPIPQDAWAAIEAACRRFVSEKREHGASTAASFNKGRTALAKRLAKALDLLTLDDYDRRVMDEATDLFGLDRPSAPQAPEAAVATAAEAIMTALMVLERAEVQTVQFDAPGKAGATFARSVRDTLSAAGFDVRLSYGRELQGRFGEKPSETDLTPFEQVLSLFGVHAAETPDAFARWARDALSGEN